MNKTIHIKQKTKEITEASKALADWFESQDINPAEATFVLANLLAAIMVNGAKSKKKLLKRYDLFADILSGITADKWVDRND